MSDEHGPGPKHDAGQQGVDDGAASGRLRIERLAWGGEGVARESSGRVVFVEGGLPGDLVEVVFTEEKRRFARARVERYVERAFEAEIGCAYAERCGGCQFQGVPYELELQWKVDALQQTLKRLARDVSWPAPEVVPALRTVGYRQRARLRLGSSGGSGFLERGSRQVLVNEACPVVAPEINAARPAVDALLHGLRGVHGYYIEHDARSGKLVVTVRTESSAAMHGIAALLREGCDKLPPEAHIHLAVAYRDQHVSITGDWSRTHLVDGAAIEVAGGQFSQANTELNRSLVDAVVREAGRLGARRCADLFCGYGNFTFPLAASGLHTVGVELPGLALEAGHRHALQLGEEAPRFIAADLSSPLSGVCAEAVEGADTVVVDPPRGGLAKGLVQYLVDVAALKGCVYVSCDPPALARDMQALAQGGFSVKSILVFDMFPRTAHLEVVAVLSRG